MLNTLAPLSPAMFFDCTFTVKRRKSRRYMRSSLVPNLSKLLGEEHFADLGFYWSDQGFHIDLLVRKPLTHVAFPNFRRGDSLEFLINTRELTKVSVVTRFCHHFVFLPEEIENIQAHEVTRFRADDTHDLADPKLFIVKVTPSRLEYRMEIEIPNAALYGYDPETVTAIGFAYRVNRADGEPQHLPLSSRFFNLEKHPDLWATAHLGS
ncbi:MAG: hypothetical protein AAF443_02985 [Chlamydiota bacterium]